MLAVRLEGSTAGSYRKQAPKSPSEVMHIIVNLENWSNTPKLGKGTIRQLGAIRKLTNWRGPRLSEDAHHHGLNLARSM